MEVKSSLPAELVRSKSLSALVEIYFEIVHLKQLFRQGWLRRGVPKANCESVAEHSFGVALLALLTAEAHFPHLDSQKVVAMALLHNLGEVYAGDFTPADGITPEDKQRLERQSIEQTLLKLSGGSKYVALWEEHDQGTTAEARFVRELDRLEMSLQASVYQQQSLLDPTEFFSSTRSVLASPIFKDVLQELEKLHEEGSNVAQ